MNIEEKNFYLYGDNDTPVVIIETDDEIKALGCHAFINGRFMLRISILPHLFKAVEITEEEFIKKTDKKKYEKLLKEYS
jgi:hypothetical protein